ncbi:hypothetical protein R3W88_024485 [Solanum pinnatisectum]|uniref:Uncharacterized protein n=1 Tax=Solanum pinnatisectum TaxID=50273 RepID=A0AAV9M0T6_9SOLN|nr:hypothetical protein R3W88_024485 [Solanum pinnatisectum]
MEMRATILEENMGKMVNIALLVRMEKKHLVEAPMVMRKHVRDLTLNPRVKMVPMMMPEHVTLPTLRMRAYVDSYSYSCTNPYPSRSSVCGYTSSSQSYPKERRDCATPKSKDTLSYTSHGNAHYSGFGNQGRYDRCVKGISTKRINFPIFKGWCDPEAYQSGSRNVSRFSNAMI